MTKKEIVELLYKKCKEKKIFEFDNDFVKKILAEAGSSTNPYDIIS